MNESAQILSWALGVSIVVGVNLFNRKDPDALGLSMMLLIMWVISNVLAAFYAPPDSMRLYPFMDLAGGLTAYVAYKTRKAWWKLGLAYLLLIQASWQAYFWMSRAVDDFWLRDGPTVGTHTVLAWLNVLFILQLILVGGVGIRNVASSVLAGLRRGSSLGHRLGI